MSLKLNNSVINPQDASIFQWMVKGTLTPYITEKCPFQPLHATTTDLSSNEESSENLFDSQSTIGQEEEGDDTDNTKFFLS